MKNDILAWDDYFMSLAHLSAKRSKDPNTKVGAVIVNNKQRVVGIGYNGFPRTLHSQNDEDYPWEKQGTTLDTKYAYVVHAELNAILNANQAVDGCKIYVSLFPCNECAKAIIQAGIVEIVYEDDKYFMEDSVKASKLMLKNAGVTLRKLEHRLEIDVKII